MVVNGDIATTGDCDKRATPVGAVNKMDTNPGQKARKTSVTGAPTQNKESNSARARRELQRGRQAAHSQSGLGLVKSAATTPTKSTPKPSENAQVIPNKIQVNNKSLEESKLSEISKSKNSLIEINKSINKPTLNSAKSSNNLESNVNKSVIHKHVLNASKSSPALDVKSSISSKAVVTRSSTAPVHKLSVTRTPPTAPLNSVKSRSVTKSTAARRPSKPLQIPAIPFCDVYDQVVNSKPFSNNEGPYIDLQKIISESGVQDDVTEVIILLLG